MKAILFKKINNYLQSKADWRLKYNTMYNLKTKNYESKRRQ